LLRNPLADPFVFGLSAGRHRDRGGDRRVRFRDRRCGGVGGVVRGRAPDPAGGGGGCHGRGAVVFTLGRARGHLDPARALLVGVVFNSFASALVLSVEAVLRPDQLQAVSLWLAGTLGYEAMPLLAGAGIALIVPALVLLALAGRLNLLALETRGPRRWAWTSGARACSRSRRQRRGGIAVAFTGLVGFVGLIVPRGPAAHRSGHRVVLPASALGGAFWCSPTRWRACSSVDWARSRRSER